MKEGLSSATRRGSVVLELGVVYSQLSVSLGESLDVLVLDAMLLDSSGGMVSQSLPVERVSLSDPSLRVYKAAKPWRFNEMSLCTFRTS